MHDSRLGRWHSIDPHSENYFSWSPYVYVGNNPLKFIDPDGRDLWEFDDLGEIINRIKDRTQDTFHMVDGDGARMDGKSISFGYGTVVDVRNPTISTIDEGGNISSERLTLFEIKGDDNATQLFEFMATPGETTNVEWSHTKIGMENYERNIVGTMHKEGATGGGAYLLEKGYTIRGDNHSHTNGITTPSWGDIYNATLFNTKFPNIPLNIYTSPGQYFPYNKKTDYRIIGMPEIIITAPKLNK